MLKEGIHIVAAAGRVPQIRFMAGITEGTVALFARTLDELSAKGHKEFELVVTSGGGSVIHGNAMIDAIKSSPVKLKRIIGSGMVASMAAFLLAAFKSKAYLYKTTEFMVHQPQGSIYGKASDLRSYADRIDTARKNLRDQLAEATGLSADQVETEFFPETDKWMTAQQAVDAGLVVGVLDSKAPEKKLESLQADARMEAAIVMAAADLEAADSTPDTHSAHNPPNSMKELEIVAEALGLNKAAAQETILAEVQKIVDLNDTLKTKNGELEAKVKGFEDAAKEAAVEEIKAAVEEGIRTGRILASERERMEKWGAHAPEDMKAFISAQPVHESLTAQLADNQQAAKGAGKLVGLPDNLQATNYDDLLLEETDLARSLAAEHPETLKALFKRSNPNATSQDLIDCLNIA